MNINMILYKMEFLFSIYLTNFASYVHLTKHFIHFANLLFNLGKYRSAIKAATYNGIPISTVFSQYFLISVQNKLFIGIPFWN
jgi:hypothetical protein